MTITTVTYGVTEVYNAYAAAIPVTSKVICALAQELMELAKEATDQAAVRETVHRMMRAACQDDVSFQISNGDRKLLYTGGEHSVTDFLIALPGDTIILWSFGK